MGYTTYTSKEKVKARKVTAAEGETVVTTNGPRHVVKGDYVTNDGRVFTAEEFESRYGRAKKKTRKAVTASNSETPPVIAGAKDKETSNPPTPTDAASARKRVAAAKAARGK